MQSMHNIDVKTSKNKNAKSNTTVATGLAATQQIILSDMVSASTLAVIELSITTMLETIEIRFCAHLLKIYSVYAL